MIIRLLTRGNVYSLALCLFFVGIFTTPSFALAPFQDNFESGNLNNWTIGGRRQYGVNRANVVDCGAGNQCGHLLHDYFTEISMFRDFAYDSVDPGTFHFDMANSVFSQPSPVQNYYGSSGVHFNFLDAANTKLASVRYLKASTDYVFSLDTTTLSLNKILGSGMQHYHFNVSDLLSQISIDESQIKTVQVLLDAYSSTNPYPYISSELLVDNFSTFALNTTVPEPLSSTLFLFGGAVFTRAIVRRKKSELV